MKCQIAQPLHQGGGHTKLFYIQIIQQFMLRPKFHYKRFQMENICRYLLIPKLI